MSIHYSARAHLTRAQSPRVDYDHCRYCGEPWKHTQAHSYVCASCGWHRLMPARARMAFIFDGGQWESLHDTECSSNPLRCEGYEDYLKKNEEKTGLSEALLLGMGRLEGMKVCVLQFAFEFAGGSMGAAVGDRFVLAARDCLRQRCPMVVFVSSGGARMQEGIASLVQMARVSAAIAHLHEAGIPYITCLCHPTTGGVLASLAMLGDWIIAEPEAYISFTGARVLTAQDPQRCADAQSLCARGHIDAIVPRDEQRAYLAMRLRLLAAA